MDLRDKYFNKSSILLYFSCVIRKLFVPLQSSILPKILANDTKQVCNSHVRQVGVRLVDVSHHLWSESGPGEDAAVDQEGSKVSWADAWDGSLIAQQGL